MSNVMSNGAVLPSGLLGINHGAAMDAFKKTFQNTALKMGVIIKSYPVGGDGNITGLCPEYDVVAFEQNEDRGATAITYKNCVSSEGLGSVADFFEKTLRTQTKKGDNVDTKGQDGAIVILLCLNGTSDRGIIIGALTHPDRNTTLVDEGPRLEGEFNGVNIKVEKDGSTSLTFNGATDSDGNALDASQGITTLSVEKDGSYQVQNKGVTQRLEKGGAVSLTAQDTITNTTKKDFVVTAQGDINATATGNMNLTAKQLAAQISGSAAFQCQSGQITSSDAFGIKGSTLTAEAESMVKIKAPVIVLDGLVSLGGQGGLPVLTLGTTIFGIGNLGLPVISRAIAGFANKVKAT